MVKFGRDAWFEIGITSTIGDYLRYIEIVDSGLKNNKKINIPIGKLFRRHTRGFLGLPYR